MRAYLDPLGESVVGVVAGRADDLDGRAEAGPVDLLARRQGPADSLVHNVPNQGVLQGKKAAAVFSPIFSGF